MTELGGLGIDRVRVFGRYRRRISADPVAGVGHPRKRAGLESGPHLCGDRQCRNAALCGRRGHDAHRPADEVRPRTRRAGRRQHGLRHVRCSAHDRSHRPQLGKRRGRRRTAALHDPPRPVAACCSSRSLPGLLSRIPESRHSPPSSSTPAGSWSTSPDSSGSGRRARARPCIYRRHRADHHLDRPAHRSHHRRRAGCDRSSSGRYPT